MINLFISHTSSACPDCLSAKYFLDYRFELKYVSKLFVAFMVGMYITLQYLLSAMAIRMDGDDKRIIAFSVFLVIGYKQLTDILQLKAVVEEVFGRKATWTSASRVRDE